MSGTAASRAPSPEDLAYVEKARLATRRISEGARDDVAPAVEELRGARFDLGLPAGGHRKEVELFKAALNKVLSRYARYVTAQLESFATKLVRVAEALASRADRLQETGDELLARVSAIEERLSRLEKRPAPGEPAPRGPAKGRQGPSQGQPRQGRPGQGGPAPAERPRRLPNAPAAQEGEGEASEASGPQGQ